MVHRYLFTPDAPNGERFALYCDPGTAFPRGAKSRPVEVTCWTADGRSADFRVASAPCGTGCHCAATVTPVDRSGYRLLADADYLTDGTPPCVSFRA